MIIKEGTWHHRLASVYGSKHWLWDRPRNLCEYIRRVFYGLFTILLLVAVTSYLTACVLRVWFAPLLGLPYDDGDITLFVLGMTLHGIAVIALSIAAVQERWIQTMWRKLVPRKESDACRYYPKRAPNPFIQWIKDRHSKVCRLVTYVD